MPSLTSTSLGQFCREIAIQLSPLPTLLQEWGITPDEFDRLRETHGYKHEMTVLANEMAELGADAGYVYRMKALSEIFIEDIVEIMKDSETPRQAKVDLIKFCAEMARLKEKPVPAGQALNTPRGPSVVFHFGEGLPIKTVTVVPEASNVISLPTMRGFDMEPVSE